MTITAKPWMKFYPQDWRADEKLRNCSMAARGLWVEMLALMHRSDEYGYLLINGRAPTDQQLANQVGASLEEVTRLLAELNAEDVFSRDRRGVIYSRRMVRDEIKHSKQSKMGRKGAIAKAAKTKEKEAALKGTPEGTLCPRGQRPDTLSKDNGEIADPDKIFWANAKAWIAPHISGDPGALIGKWLREHRKEMTEAAITAGQLEGAVNPVEYCQGYFRRHAKLKDTKSGEPSDFLAWKIRDDEQRKAWEARQAASGA